MDILDDTVIVIPSKRPPPIKTLEAHPTNRLVIVISDPRVINAHREYVLSHPNLTNIIVEEGKVGMIPQSAMCYRVAWKHGFQYYFRMDDDLHPGMFVTVDGIIPFETAMFEARKCAEYLKTSLNGFQNTSRKDWLGSGYKRTYGLIHGGAHLCCSTEDPSIYIDETLPAYEDVYRSAAHREVDGSVGRVAFIGLDKRATLRDSSMNKSKEVQEEAKRIILGRFPKTVTCKGTRTLDAGMQTIPNWRLVRGPSWIYS